MKILISIKKTTYFVFFLTAFTLTESCRQVQTTYGKSEIINKTVDNSLNDSVLIYGKVISAVDSKIPRINARIWVNELTKDTHSDNIGSYSLKLPSGVYTINCQEYFGIDEFIETRKNVSLLPNEKVEIYFYLGSRSE